VSHNVGAPQSLIAQRLVIGEIAVFLAQRCRMYFLTLWAPTSAERRFLAPYALMLASDSKALLRLT
jgi:hypothetical protein